MWPRARSHSFSSSCSSLLLTIIPTLQASLPILTLLLSTPGNTADVAALMRSGRTALHLAAEAGREEMVEVLVGREGVLVDGEDLMGRQTPLLLAVRGGHVGTAR